jgi:hypothetical protein
MNADFADLKRQDSDLFAAIAILLDRKAGFQEPFTVVPRSLLNGRPTQAANRGSRPKHAEELQFRQSGQG